MCLIATHHGGVSCGIDRFVGCSSSVSQGFLRCRLLMEARLWSGMHKPNRGSTPRRHHRNPGSRCSGRIDTDRLWTWLTRERRSAVAVLPQGVAPGGLSLQTGLGALGPFDDRRVRLETSPRSELRPHRRMHATSRQWPDVCNAVRSAYPQRKLAVLKLIKRALTDDGEAVRCSRRAGHFTVPSDPESSRDRYAREVR